ncbi:MAG: S16 family serine protease, partial [Nanoarchaeota archaeon]
MGKKTLIFLLVLLLLPIAFAKSGSMRLLAVANTDLGQRGSVADIYLEIKPGTGRVFIDSFPLSQVDTQISTRFAKEVACNFIEADCTKHDFFYTIRSTSGLVGGPSAGAATAVLTVAVLEGLPIDQEATITGTINTGGLIGPVGGVSLKLDAASKNKITKVLVPKHTLSNETNISENLEVVEVSHLAEAVKEITGKDYTNTGNLELDKTYIEVMKKLSVDICERATGLIFILDAKNEKYELGQKAINDTKYYSAASYCFIASLELRNEFLLQKNLSENEINKEINKIFSDATALKEEIDKTEINTITDLETYMVVSSRIAEAREKLDDSLKSLNESKVDASIFNLAYGIERLNTAKSWAGFFSTFGKEFKLDKGAIEESCLKK